MIDSELKEPAIGTHAQIGLGTTPSIDKISIDWPSGARQELKGPIPANQPLTITEE